MKASSAALIVAPTTTPKTSLAIPSSQNTNTTVTTSASAIVLPSDTPYKSNALILGLNMDQRATCSLNLSNTTVDMLSGALTGVIATFVAHPLDTVKVRFQIS